MDGDRQDARALRREAKGRLLFYVIAGAAGLSALAFDFGKGLGSAYLIWGSFFSIGYAGLTLHPNLRSKWAPRFEAFGIVLVAWGALMVTELPRGFWSAVAFLGVCLFMAGFHYIYAQDAKQQER